MPTANGNQAATHQQIGLVSCGGQASLPVLYALAQHYRPQCVEMVATAASVSMGRASRLNLDEYVETTQDAIRRFTGTGAARAMLNISAAEPPPPFRIAMTMVAPGWSRTGSVTSWGALRRPCGRRARLPDHLVHRHRRHGPCDLGGCRCTPGTSK